MNAVIAACFAAPLVAIVVYDLQSWLVRWDYERHREDWRSNLRYVEVAAIGPILDEQQGNGTPNDGCDNHDEKEITVRSWIENRLCMLVATYYTAAMARAITALPDDELTWQVEPSLGLAGRCPSDDTETQILWTQDLCNTASTVDKEQPMTHTDDQTCHELNAHAVSAYGADFVSGVDPSALAGAKGAVSRREWVPTGSAVLVVKRGPNAGSQFRLDQPVTSTGRHPDSNIFLDDMTVSRRHAEFRRERGEFRVVDVCSLNGTHRNGQPIGSAVLTNGDEIGMGKFRLVFLTGPATGRPRRGRPQLTNRIG